MKRWISLLMYIAFSLSSFAQHENIPVGWSIGKIAEYQCKTKAECNMVSQANSYMRAVMYGDVDNAGAYLYPDAVRYFRKFFPNQSDKAIIRLMFSKLSDETSTALKKYSEMGVTWEMKVSRIKRQCTQGDYLIIVFDAQSHLYNEEKSMYSDPDETIAISLNKGVNWTFIEKNSDTPNILRYKFNQETITIVMGY